MATRISDAQAERIAQAWPELLDAFAAGEVMAPHYKRFGTTSDQVRVWRMRDPAREAEWNQAREHSADAMADSILDVAYNPGADSNAARVKIQALQWLAGRRNPRSYADKATLDVNVRTVDLTRIIESANARLAQARAAQIAGRIVEGEVLEHGSRRALADLL